MLAEVAEPALPDVEPPPPQAARKSARKLRIESAGITRRLRLTFGNLRMVPPGPVSKLLRGAAVAERQVRHRRLPGPDRLGPSQVESFGRSCRPAKPDGPAESPGQSIPTATASRRSSCAASESSGTPMNAAQTRGTCFEGLGSE